MYSFFIVVISFWTFLSGMDVNNNVSTTLDSVKDLRSLCVAATVGYIRAHKILPGFVAMPGPTKEKFAREFLKQEAPIRAFAALDILPFFRVQAYHCTPALNKNDSLIAYCDQENHLTVYDIVNKKEREGYTINVPVRQIAFDSDDNLIFCYDGHSQQDEAQSRIVKINRVTERMLEITCPRLISCALNDHHQALLQIENRDFHIKLVKNIDQRNKSAIFSVRVPRNKNEICTFKWHDEKALVLTAHYNQDAKPIEYSVISIDAEQEDGNFLSDDKIQIIAADSGHIIIQSIKEDILTATFTDDGSIVYLNEQGQVKQLCQNGNRVPVGTFKPTARILGENANSAEHYYLEDTYAGIVALWSDCRYTKSLVIKHMDGFKYFVMPSLCNHCKVTESGTLLTINAKSEWHHNTRHFYVPNQSFPVELYNLPMDKLDGTDDVQQLLKIWDDQSKNTKIN